MVKLTAENLTGMDLILKFTPLYFRMMFIFVK